MSEQLTVTKTVDASPDALFAVLSTPAKHTEIDGSAMLRGLDGPGEVSGVGDTFVMKMNNDLLGDYQILNTIHVYEPNRTIGWSPQLHPQDGYTDKLGDTKVKGHTYTWHLEADGDGTKVTQVYDWSGVDDPNFKGMFPLLSEDQLKDSIDKAAQVAK